VLRGRALRNLYAVLAIVAVGLIATRRLRLFGRTPSRGTSVATSTATATSSSSPGAQPAGPDVLRLVAPLVAGGELGGFTVREIRAVSRGHFRVVCENLEARVSLDVALKDDASAAAAPATTTRFAVYYALRGATSEDGAVLATGLARLLQSNESAPIPEGMTTFKPAAPPGTNL
jgi:hypothetical protein